jgi:hypothetical protein
VWRRPVGCVSESVLRCEAWCGGEVARSARKGCLKAGGVPSPGFSRPRGIPLFPRLGGFFASGGDYPPSASLLPAWVAAVAAAGSLCPVGWRRWLQQVREAQAG